VSSFHEGAHRTAPVVDEGREIPREELPFVPVKVLHVLGTAWVAPPGFGVGAGNVTKDMLHINSNQCNGVVWLCLVLRRVTLVPSGLSLQCVGGNNKVQDLKAQIILMMSWLWKY
jgi:hypothetical protein